MKIYPFPKSKSDLYRMKTILLVDDHQIVRVGLRAILQSEPEFKVIGEACDGAEALRCVDKLRPDVLVTDVQMPEFNGIEVCKRVSTKYPRTRIVILSMYDSETFIKEAFAAGAQAYVLKRSSTDDLVHAIHEALAERHYVSPAIAAQEAYRQFESSLPADDDASYEALTSREKQVLCLLSEGLTNVEIAARLKISRRTVEGHRARLSRKLGASTQVDLIRFAIRKGLVQVDFGV
jgi:DNA-binding NarL/FixJ family response regulator